MTRPVINIRGGLGTVAEGGEITNQSSNFPDPLKQGLIILGVSLIILGVLSTIYNCRKKSRRNGSQLSDAENATKTDSEDQFPGNTAHESKPQFKPT
ncbi:hypothetical protein K435DRAFT_434903 [Dendrothele bispora CBS 962.96]|uniref:Uncharacterized protein n=1 Tax=Dendrothele bispora (strain CBS 962.96) TaxID=1314807 RepID=A0A4V6T522_DENBC|nr:hypothetical protein K435DRAFT_434903 [Dendrothele bispora CBS 962.96]